MTKSAEWVQDAMAACTGGVSPIRTIVASAFTNKRTVEATVELFDGRPGTLQVAKYGEWDAWSIQWLDLPGGAMVWNGTAWQRVVRVPMQFSLFGREVS